MKKITTCFAVLFLSITGLISCSDSALTPNPLSFYSADDVYTDGDGFESVLITLRKALNRETHGNQHFLMLEFASSDLAVPGDQPDFHVLTPSGSRYKYLSMFEDVYGYIKDANLVISRIDDLETDDEPYRNRILAEAYWHRAYWYYRLVHSYGDVPWIGEELQKPKLDFQTHSRWTIIDKIQKDLEFATEWLPESATPDVPSRYAALQLLTKVYLANTEFENAVQTASEIISGPFQLMSQRFGSYADDPQRNVIWDLHRPENKNLNANTETIYTVIDRPEAPSNARTVGTYSQRTYAPHWWTIPDESGSRGVDWTIPMGDTLGQGNADVNANHFYTRAIWNEGDYTHEDTPDLRRAPINWVNMTELTYSVPSSPNLGEPITQDYFANLNDTTFMWFDWPHYKTFVPANDGCCDGRPRGGNGDWYIYRLAETYLLRAEAYYWLGENGMAAQDINEVRDRANAEPISAADVDIDYIFHERARELYAEEPRHSEMVRVANIMAQLNRNGYSLENISSNNWYYDRVMRFNNWYHGPQPYTRRGGAEASISPYHIYWPIPQSTITANTMGQINQNDGYDGAENNVPPLETIEE